MGIILLEGEPNDSSPISGVIDFSEDINVILDDSPSTMSIDFLDGAVGGAPVTLGSISDVSLEGLEDESILIYKNAEQKWRPAKKLETHTIEAGQY